MKRISLSIFVFTAIFLTSARSAQIVDTLTIQKTLKFAASVQSRSILVNNINGSINVVGYDGNEVQLIAYRTIRAESNRKLLEAKESVILDLKEDSDRVLIYVDAPWRRGEDCCNYRGRDYYGYDVDYDFELRVPSKTNFSLKTINHGKITVQHVDGDFEIGNVNGAIDLQDIGGSGKATTVNGNVRVTFNANPVTSSSFKTINGDVEIRFKDKLSANLKLKTMNGEVYSDFPVKDIPTQAAFHETRGHRKVYRSGDSFSVQAGDGGPDFSFGTLNGNIYIMKNTD